MTVIDLKTRKKPKNQNSIESPSLTQEQIRKGLIQEQRRKNIKAGVINYPVRYVIDEPEWILSTNIPPGPMGTFSPIEPYIAKPENPDDK